MPPATVSLGKAMVMGDMNPARPSSHWASAAARDSAIQAREISADERGRRQARTHALRPFVRAKRAKTQVIGAAEGSIIAVIITAHMTVSHARD